MKGMPKTWNSKKDVMYCFDYWPNQTKEALQKFIDNRMEWLIDHKMTDTETGTEDDTHKVAKVTDEDDNVTERYQMVLQEDPNAKIFRLGFTIREATDLVG